MATPPMEVAAEQSAAVKCPSFAQSALVVFDVKLALVVEEAVHA